jgi:hypothetical protein
MFYYKFKNKILISDTVYQDFEEVPESHAVNNSDIVYFLNNTDPLKSRKRFSISDPSLVFLKSENLDLLKKQYYIKQKLPDLLTSKIELRKAVSINTSHPDWVDSLDYVLPDKWTINVIGLGDVGGTLVTGLRLLGGEHISKIGLYDRDENKINRWVYETGQIFAPFSNKYYPEICGIAEDQIFDCDMFVFCVSVGVPSIGNEGSDVRMVQFEGNSRVIGSFAKLARNSGFKGIFAVVSDPVDLLCKSAFIQSNTNENNDIDFKGISPEQIRGYGLGVMNARAVYYAKQNPNTFHFLEEGRVFGPHGGGLIVADSIKNYNEELSLLLTEKARNANIDVRKTGFKPYIAPAFSSGCLSILATISGDWHYSATYMGGVYMGSKNRQNKTGIELEMLDIPDLLWKRLEDTYESLGKII